MTFNPSIINDFIGKGFTLPLTIENGRPKLETGFDLIKKSIMMVLNWEFGERFFLNEFGSRIEQFIEEPNDDVLESLLDTFVREAISVWETRVELMNVTLERPNDYAINLRLHYRIINTHLEDTFIYPYYTKINY